MRTIKPLSGGVAFYVIQMFLVQKAMVGWTIKKKGLSYNRSCAPVSALQMCTFMSAKQEDKPVELTDSDMNDEEEGGL